jgi:regulator of ribonuclease activity A
VIDAGGSMNCAMLGDKRVTDAINNKWEGIIVNGVIRDSAVINTMPIGIRALGVYPLKSVKKGAGKNNLIINFSNVEFTPNQYLYADEDGVIVTQNKVNL